MKTFEEKLAAWIEGDLSGAELAAFEKEMEARHEVFSEDVSDMVLGNLLREHLVAPPLRNADFFNHEILRQIESSRPAETLPARRRSFWSLPRMAFSGLTMLAFAAVLYRFTVPNTRPLVRHEEQYVSNIINAQSDDPHVSVTSFHSTADNVNVVWLDGLDYMPPDHKLK